MSRNHTTVGWAFLPVVLASTGRSARPTFVQVVAAVCTLLLSSSASAFDEPSLPAEKESAETIPLTPPQPDDAAEQQSAEHRVQWLHSLDEAVELARTRRTPILAIYGAVWCGPCRQLEKEIEHAAVQKELERWVPVHLDVDEEPAAAKKMAVSAIPALRIVTPDGRVVGQQDGLMPAEVLSAWLGEQFEVASAEAKGERVTAKLTSMTVRTVLKDFRSRESTIREAAVSRVVEIPELAAAHVVAGFVDASLSERLAFLDVLTAWEAPVEGLDPWIPTTVTTERVTELEQWLEKKNFPKPSDSSTLSASEFIEAHRLLRRLLTAEEAEAVACREQLARLGPAVLPIVREAIHETVDDDARVRLTMARYRVAASIDLVTQWPEGITRLSSPEFNKRVAAVHELSTRATAREEGLLAELVADPAPLVREIVLGAMKRIGGARAGGPLVKMLADPDPNVRAAVLKHLADTKSVTLVATISDFIKTEADMDLVVHAVRCLREITDSKATEVLLPLTEHPSWRVRAEAIEGVNSYLKQASRTTPSNVPAPITQSTSQLFLKRIDDEDGFVVGKVMEGLDHIATPTDKEQTALLNALDRAAVRHPGLARVIFSRASTRNWRSHDYDKTLQTFSKHEIPAIRAAAIAQRVASRHESAWPDLRKALNDDDANVRVASMNVLAKEIRQLILTTAQTQIVELAASQRVAKAPVAAEVSVIASKPEASGGLLSVLGSLLGGSSQATVEIESSVESHLPENSDPPGYTAEQSDQVFAKLIGDRTLKVSIYQFEEALQGHFENGSPAEKLAAARCLSMLGDEEVLAFVIQSATSRASMDAIAELLPALAWNHRLELFHQLLLAASSAEDRALVAEHLAGNQDPRSTEVIWPLVANPEMTQHESVLLFPPLRSSWSAERYVSKVNVATKESMIRDGRDKASAGIGWQRIVGLAMMSWCESPDVAESARSTVSDTNQPTDLRVVALQIRLVKLDAKASEQEVLSLLSDPDPMISETALRFLSLGASGMTSLTNLFPIPTTRMINYSESDTEPSPVSLDTPEGLTIDQIKPFLQSSQIDVAVSAAHLLALMHDPQSLGLLIDHWHAEPADLSAQKMLYQSITATNDAQYVPVLEELYFQMTKSEWIPNLGDFYWTVRAMTGPEITALREKIRDEQGADKLRQVSY